MWGVEEEEVLEEQLKMVRCYRCLKETGCGKNNFRCFQEGVVDVSKYGGLNARETPCW